MPAARVSFANLICTFGNKGLLDYADVSVIPAFTDLQLNRRYGTHTSYFFHQVGFLSMPQPGEPVPLLCMYGRFVHNTLLKRTQVYTPGQGLSPDQAELESAPSSFFVLVLNNHKLVYAHETPFAPSIKVFGTTLKYFVHLKHKDFLNAEYQRLRTTDLPATRQQLNILHPYPEVDVVPLSNPESIIAFIGRFGILRHLEFAVLRPNQEIRAAEMWQGIEERRRRLDARRTIVAHDNGEGLDRTAAVEEIQEAAATGNERVRVSGKDLAGNPLKGDNEHMKTEIVAELPDPPLAKAAQLVTKYEELITTGVLAADIPGQDRVPLLQRLMGLFL
jgi:hypothetical protein